MDLSRLLFSYPLHRGAVAGLSFGAALLAARGLPSGAFSALMTAAFLARFLQILNLGAAAGYFVSRYRDTGSMMHGDLAAERRFLLFYLAQLVSLALILLGLSVIWLPEYRVGVMAFLLMVPLFVIEPSLRYRRQFSFSLTPELLLALALMVVLVASGAGLAEHRLPLIFLAALGVLGGGVLASVLRRSFGVLTGGPPRFGLRDHARIVRGGFPVYLGTALFLIAISMDRLLLPLHGSDEQVSIYFLAHQLSVGAMIFVTGLNFVNAINLGEARRDTAQFGDEGVGSALRAAAIVALGSYAVLVAGSIVLEGIFLPDAFDGLAFLVSVLGAGLAGFFISNAITPIVAYTGRAMPLTMSMGCVALVLLGNNAWVFLNDLGAVWLAAGTALAFAAHAGFAVWFTIRVTRQNERGMQAHVR